MYKSQKKILVGPIGGKGDTPLGVSKSPSRAKWCFAFFGSKNLIFTDLSKILQGNVKTHINRAMELYVGCQKNSENF